MLLAVIESFGWICGVSWKEGRDNSSQLEGTFFSQLEGRDISSQLEGRGISSQLEGRNICSEAFILRLLSIFSGFFLLFLFFPHSAMDQFQDTPL